MSSPSQKDSETKNSSKLSHLIWFFTLAGGFAGLAFILLTASNQATAIERWTLIGSITLVIVFVTFLVASSAKSGRNIASHDEAFRTEIEALQQILSRTQSDLAEAAKRQSETIRAHKLQVEELINSSTSDGYMWMPIPDKEKSLFMDLLRGFEDYSAIRGFPIQVSISNTQSGKLGVKFTIVKGKAERTDAELNDDWKEFIRIVERGDMPDIEAVLPRVEHNALLLQMRNRIAFLQNTYTHQKNVIEFYKGTLNEIKQIGLASTPSQHFHFEGQTSFDAGNYSAVNSSLVAQGKGNKLTGNTSRQTVRIGTTYKEKQEQVHQLDSLIQQLHKMTESKERDEAVKMLTKTKDELTDEEKPDASRIEKWLHCAKASLGTFALTAEVVESLEKVFKIFGIG